MVEIFDRVILAQKRARAASLPDDTRFLLSYTAQQLLERLTDIKRKFPNALQIGGRDDEVFSKDLCAQAGIQNLVKIDLTPALNPDRVVDEEFLPFEPNIFDLIISNLCLHSTNDLPGVLIQARRALKPDGLFIASMFGGETLRELRESLMQGEMAISGGISPRVMPFADKPQMGDLLQRAGFALPVVDSDIVTVTYGDIIKLMHDLRGMGETNIVKNRSRSFMRRDMLAAAAAYYADHFSNHNGRLEASFEIIFLIGWSPHESQQKPLKPGSAQVRLADALGGTEERL